jgi:hypothetical protein
MEVDVAWSQLCPGLGVEGQRKARKTSGNIACVVSETRTGQFAQRLRVYYGYTRPD